MIVRNLLAAYTCKLKGLIVVCLLQSIKHRCRASKWDLQPVFTIDELARLADVNSDDFVEDSLGSLLGRNCSLQHNESYINTNNYYRTVYSIPLPLALTPCFTT